MVSSSVFFTSFVLLGNALAYPRFPVKRDPATCVQDNLLRCFINTKYVSAASALCAGLTPFTKTVATVIATASVTTSTTVVASTQTNGVTVLVTSTINVPVVASTVYIGVPAVAKRSIPPPNCFTAGTTYPAARLTSACSCIGVPASTVLGYTYTQSTSTTTVVSIIQATTTTMVTTTSTAMEIDTTLLTTTITTTSSPAPKPTVCGVPSAQNIVANPGFECDTLDPWTSTTTYLSIYHTGDQKNLDLTPPGTSSYLQTTANSLVGRVTQALTTTPGAKYQVSFKMYVSARDQVPAWSVDVGGTVVTMRSLGGFGMPYFWTYTGSFVAASSADVLGINFQAQLLSPPVVQYWDDFTITPASSI